MAETPVTVVETPEFIAATRKLMDEEERVSLIDYLARNPIAGDLVPDAGGIRKVRWRLAGRGKRGGARVIYYYHSQRFPLFALTAYAKSERDDLSQAQREDFRTLAKSVVEVYSMKTPGKKK